VRVPFMDYVPENEDRWAMLIALERRFSQKYPESKTVIEEMCSTLIAALCLTAPTCISTIGLQEAWEKRLDDIARVNHAAPATMIWANEVGVERNQC